MHEFGRASCLVSCFLFKTMEIIIVENFQEVSKVNDKNEDKTIKLICNLKEASPKWTKQESSIQNGTEAGPS